LRPTKRILQFLFRSFWPSIIWVVSILVLTGIPGTMLPDVPRFMNLLQPDKLIHIALFGIYAILLVGTLKVKYAGSKFYGSINEITLFSGIVLAGVSELMQRYIVWGRSGNIYDFIADCIGLAVGIYLGIRLVRNLKLDY
jgi:hypothetical protein